MAQTTAPFPTDPQMTALAIAYKNAKRVGDRVALRSNPPLAKRSFKWWVFDLGDTLTIPDTRVGRTSRPNEVEFSATQADDSVTDYGLEDPIPQDDIDEAAGTGYDPKLQAAENLTDLIELDRERRVAKLAEDPASYAADQVLTLSGTDQFSDPASDPLGVFSDAMDGMLVRPNIAVMALPTLTLLRRHPQIVQAIHGNEGKVGKVSLQALLDLLELEEIVAGEAWANVARRGQPVQRSRVWANDFISLQLRDPMASLMSKRPTFMMTAQYKTRIAGWKQDDGIGLRGGLRYRVGESVKERVVAPHLGFLIRGVR